MTNTVTKKFQFGAGFGEILNEAIAIQQMRSRNYLRNELVALDRATREQYYSIVNADNPSQVRISRIGTEIQTLQAAIKMLRVRRKQSESSRLVTRNCAEKDRIEALKKERRDLSPLAKAAREATKAVSGEALATLRVQRKSKVNALRTRAVAGYTHCFTAKSGEQVQIEVSALYNLNADEIIAQHDTERSRAMKDKTELRWYKFAGEGRSSVRVHLPPCTEPEFVAGQEAIRTLREKRRSLPKAKQAGVSTQIAEKKAELATKFGRLSGRSVEEVFGGELNEFRINAVNLQRDAQNPTIWSKDTTRGDRRRAMRTVAHIRVQSTDKGKPIFISVPFVMHRPFPDGAQILSAAVNREKIGMKFRWNVEFTVKFNEVSQHTLNAETRLQADTVAIDLGWAKDSLPEPDGRVRVAGVRERDANGKENFYEFYLPSSFTEYAKKLNDIQSIRDSKTVEAFTKIAAFREVYDITDAGLSELLDKARHSFTLAQSKGLNLGNAWHLRSAVWMLRNSKADAQLELKDILEDWYERWNHLNEWLSNGRDNQLAAKKDLYRRFAYKLAQTNGTLLLDADNFAKMAKKPAPETDKGTCANDVRFLAAPAMLRSALVACFCEAKGKRTLWTSLASSKTCSHCEHVGETLGASREFLCAICGHKDDREANATQNVLNEFLTKPGSFSADKKVAERLYKKKAEETAELLVIAQANAMQVAA